MLKDIKVIYSKYNNDVKLEPFGDIIILFNHNNINPKINYGLFTGIALTKQLGVIPKVFDFDFNEIKFIVSQDYLYLDIIDDSCYNNPIGFLEFYPNSAAIGAERFKPHMIEKKG